MESYYTNLKNKTALVTGASSGIGYKTASFLAEQGCRVFAVARRQERLLELKTKFQNLTPITGDLNKESTLKEIEAAKAFNVDILINNAGLALGKDLLHEAQDEDIDTVIQTNLITALKIAKRCLFHMKKNGTGDIVNITSIASHEAYKGGVTYTASKHGLLAVSKALREETYGENIRVMSISPGMVETEFSEVRFKGDKEKAKKTYEGFTPLKSEDIAVQIINALRCPRHVNLDEIIILATDQAGATKINKISL